MSWDTTSGSFDPSEFYPDGIQPSGKFSKTPTPIRFDEIMLAICEQLAINPNLPQLKSTSDVVRDGTARGIDNALRRLDAIGKGDAELDAKFKIIIAGMKVREMADLRAHVKDSIDRLEEELKTASPQYKERLVDEANIMLEGAFHEEHKTSLKRILGID